MLPDDELDGPAPSGPSTPTQDLSDDEVEGTEWDYSDRAPGDWVVSGPLGNLGGGPGRRFVTARQAERWCREKYGADFKRMIPEAIPGDRWAALIRSRGN